MCPKSTIRRNSPNNTPKSQKYTQKFENIPTNPEIYLKVQKHTQQVLKQRKSFKKSKSTIRMNTLTTPVRIYIYEEAPRPYWSST